MTEMTWENSKKTAIESSPQLTCNMSSAERLAEGGAQRRCVKEDV